MTQISWGIQRVNENFDIFELMLMHYHFQFMEMFPVASQAEHKTPISLLIEDPIVCINLCCELHPG
jgi:hypothetical protein